MCGDDKDLGGLGALPASQDRAVAASPSSPQAVSPVPASIPSAARVGPIEAWLRRRREARMLRAYGGLQWCPWCKQCAQDNNASWRFDPHPPEMQYDALTCGVCGGRSLWLWGMGMHFIRPLDHPAQEKAA